MAITIDGTNGLTFNNATVQASAGQVLQVVSATYATAISTATNTFVTTNLTATITPKFATSKVLVMVNHGGCGKSTGNTDIAFQIARGATVVYSTAGAGFTASTTTNYIGNISLIYLDSPATTSATTYSTLYASDNNTATVFIGNTFFIGGIAPNSTITLMEIAA